MQSANKDEEQGSRYSRITETLQVTLLSGSEKGQQVTGSQDEQLTDAKLQEVNKGDVIVVGKLRSRTRQIMFWWTATACLIWPGWPRHF